LLSDHVRFWFGSGIPGRSVWCSIILVAGVHVSHADEVRQPARLGEDVQHHGRRKRAITNQPMKVRTCQSKKIATRTTTVFSKATVRITCEGGVLAHPAPWLGIDEFGPAGIVGGFSTWG
jgi:hypothetical protein